MDYENLKMFGWLIGTLMYSEPKGLTFDELQTNYAKSFCKTKDFGDKAYSKRTFHLHQQELKQWFGIEISCNRGEGFRYHIYDINSHPNHWVLELLYATQLQKDFPKLNGRILKMATATGYENVHLIIDAMQGNRMVRFDYNPIANMDAQTFDNVKPYAIVLNQYKWQLVGHTEARGIYVFELDRVKRPQILSETFTMPTDFDAEKAIIAFNK